MKYQVRDHIPNGVKESLKEYDELTQLLLHRRGIVEREKAHEFLHVDYASSLHDPFLMLGMEKAVNRILNAIENEEHIVIYSDYDCDGIPGGVILHDFFKKIEYEHFSNYIPHRHEEGYGLNISAIEKAAENNAKVLITVDCGITDREPVARANELGIDVIITDHHLQNGDLPKAFVVLNPNQDADDTYPFKGLCGAGVAFKLVQGLLAKGKFNLVEGWDKWLLDMAGLSTIADMVPLQGENRAIAKFGLHVMQKSRRPGLQQLLQRIRVNQRTISEGDVGFMIGPRINAASRMAHPMEAFRLLATDDIVEGGELAKYLDKLNTERKGIVAGISKKVIAKLDGMQDVPDVIVVGNPEWNPPLLGLVAQAVTERFKKPSFVWGKGDGDTYKGSCRSDGSVNLVTLMAAIDHVFIDAGGHAFSGGFSVLGEHIHNFENIVQEAYANLPKEDVDEVVEVDKRLTPDDVTWDTYRTIEKFAPFGVSNPTPRFLFEQVPLLQVEHFGKEKNHLRLHIAKEDGGEISAIAFFKTISDFKTTIVEGGVVSLVAEFEKSTFLGKTELRLRIIDIY